MVLYFSTQVLEPSDKRAPGIAAMYQLHQGT
jgi:hypothetical protein